MVCIAALARLADPDRAYAKTNVSTIVLGTSLVYAAPLVGHLAGGRMTYPTLLICSAVLLPALLMMPPTERYRPAEAHAGQDRIKTLSIVMMSFGAMVFAMTNAALWSFSFVLGERTGLHAGAVARAIAVAIVTVHPTVFLICMSIDMIAVYFLQPYFFGYAAALDPSGRAPATLGAAFFMALAIGPYFGGLVFEQFGYGVIGGLTMVANTFAFAIFFFVDREIADTTRRPPVFY